VPHTIPDSYPDEGDAELDRFRWPQIQAVITASKSGQPLADRFLLAGVASHRQNSSQRRARK